jgi:hypothetical protein
LGCHPKHFPEEEKMKSKALEIIKEEYKKEFPGIAEETVEASVKVLFEKALPRIAVEEENAAVKSVAGVALMAYPALKPAIDKVTDLNHDGQ